MAARARVRDKRTRSKSLKKIHDKNGTEEAAIRKIRRINILLTEDSQKKPKHKQRNRDKKRHREEEEESNNKLKKNEVNRRRTILSARKGRWRGRHNRKKHNIQKKM